MGNLLFWLGAGAAQGAVSKSLDRRKRTLSLAVGSLVGLLIAVECLFCWSARNKSAQVGLARGHGLIEQIFVLIEQPITPGR
jgi:hypothetical protein